MQAAAIGFRAHSGWAAAVVVSGSPLKPEILVRRKIEISNPALAGSRQPFHAAEAMPFEKGTEFIDRARISSRRLAEGALELIMSDLSRNGRSAANAGILCAAGRPLPDLAAILKSHALIHTAEGEFFRDVIQSACQCCSLTVARVKERELWDRLAETCGVRAPDLKRRIDALGRKLGPPWRQDEKMAAAVGWLALAQRRS